ncbi:hypothetical protein CANINC_001769 [Pichia inconspicua]|uniref:Uncharacterized protein n=1 Tax=Pichia inconspicua TaxID=52247 RepID=A0A4V4NFV8_9ASCO|nr:hypothetical protein CANINC_001769 [[Candida] inconspicua]
MVSKKHHSDGKRRLFHAITSKIPHYMPTMQTKLDTDSSKIGESDHFETKADLDQKKLFSIKDHDYETCPKADTGKEINMHLNFEVLPQNSNRNIDTPLKEDKVLTSYRANSNPITQGSGTGNFSYIESVRRAPSKRHNNYPSGSNAITPTYPFRSNATILVNTESKGISKFGFSPAESSANSDVSFAAKTDSMILNESFKGDINEYDYETFRTKHPLRLSKVKAFEQSELTSKSLFSVIESKLRINQLTEDEIVLQIPNVSIDDTRKLLSDETVEDRICERRANKGRIKKVPFDQPQLNGVDKRLYMMNNVLSSLTNEEIVSRKLEKSGLPTIFQQNGEFLKHLDSEEVNIWNSMNAEFELTMKQQREEYLFHMHERESLIDNETLHVLKCAMKHRKKEQFQDKNLEQTLSTRICKRLRDDLKNKVSN